MLAQLEPHVFVVMPFGTKPGQSDAPATANASVTPAVEVNFDEIYERLIKPALHNAKCIPFRADQEPGAGDIRTDMYFELVTADVILADISILNANVFYELGVRHGVAPRGVLMIHGGWSKRPFDVAPDRTFQYDGKLFGNSAERNEDWKKRVEQEVSRLGTQIRSALDVDNQTIGSPVYKELVGLRPADWSEIKTARAKYFGEVFADWQSRVELAKQNGWPGDILALAHDAPTRFHKVKLLWEAGSALVSMQRFDVAKPVFENVLSLDPKNHKAQTQLGLVLGRLGKIQEAKVHMMQVVKEHEHDTEAQGILGRVYKDLWRLEWKDLDTVEARQQQAVATSSQVASAIRSYDAATRKHFDYYNGINVISLVKLLEHLKQVTGEEPVDAQITDLDDMIGVVRFAAQNTLTMFGRDSEKGVWSAATLGELELVVGDAEKAKRYYRDASNAPSTDYFQVNSMLEQVLLFDMLGFRPEAVMAVRKTLEQRRDILEQRIGGLRRSDPRFKKVIVFSGHMIDKPDRPEERFPPRKEGVVRDKIAKQLEDWGVGSGDLAICGGARGGDIVFAELCASRGAEVWLFVALPEPEFLEQSVRLPDSNWEQRFFALRNEANVKVANQFERLKSPPKGKSAFERNNLWMINTARVEANNPSHIYGLLVWDEKPTGDGPGGTSDFVMRVKQLGGQLAPIINPTKLDA
jgi:tetratricopeptide (TPR) repeat protein